MVKVKEARIRLRELLRGAPHEADWILETCTGLDATGIVIKGERQLNRDETDAIEDAARRRLAGEPLQYILGEQSFMGLNFLVTKDTLIPRIDTEILAETAIAHLKKTRSDVLDIGTGSGCIGISIAKFCAGANVTLLDFNENALAAARENARRLGVNSAFSLCDILTENPVGAFDAVVSNPPYIKTDVIDTLDSEVKDYEPIYALDGGYDGLKFYRRIAELCRAGLLRRGGRLFFEIGFDQGESVPDILENTGFSDIRVIQDAAGLDRVITASRKP